jgi:peptidoglycan/xylan/chitin deacetylase (PgdA/CDA1 family)
MAMTSATKALPMRIVTTSWDDGDRADMKIAALLRARSLPGTFYIPVQRKVSPCSLSPREVIALAGEGFEIGAHTVSHVKLPGLSQERLTYEVASCKDMLEQAIAKPVSMFCYPGGRFNKYVASEVARCGYEGARTTRMLSADLRFPPFEMPTTLQAYPHTRAAYLRNSMRPPSPGRLFSYLMGLDRCRNWLELGKQLFDRVLARGGMWHLYGHSWEIESLGVWPELQKMLDYVRGREGVLYLTNGDLTRLLRSGNGMILPQGVERDLALRSDNNMSSIL